MRSFLVANSSNLWSLRIIRSLRPCVHDARNWSKILNGEKINQSHLNNSVTWSMRLVNLLSVQDLGPISCIVYTRPKVILSLSGTWWGAHPSILLLLYRSIYRSSLEYGAQVFSPFNNQGLWLKILRIQYRIIHTALGLRQSTPICVLLSEACEPPMKLRFELLTSRYIYKCLSRRFNLVVRSLRGLEIASMNMSRSKRAQLLKRIPTFKTYILQKHVRDTIHRTVAPPSLSYEYQVFIPLSQFHSFNL